MVKINIDFFFKMKIRNNAQLTSSFLIVPIKRPQQPTRDMFPEECQLLFMTVSISVSQSRDCGALRTQWWGKLNMHESWVKLKYLDHLQMLGSIRGTSSPLLFLVQPKPNRIGTSYHVVQELIFWLVMFNKLFNAVKNRVKLISSWALLTFRRVPLQR